MLRSARKAVEIVSAPLLPARPPGAPAAEFADLAGARDGIGLAQKAGHRAAIFESDRAETERRRYTGEKGADCGDRHIPYLGLDRGAGSQIEIGRASCR